MAIAIPDKYFWCVWVINYVAGVWVGSVVRVVCAFIVTIFRRFEFPVNLRTAKNEPRYAKSENMSINNTLFFKDPFSNLPNRVKRHGQNVFVHEMTDDNFDTSSAVADVAIDISDGTNPTAVDYIFLKYTGDLTR